METCEGCGSTSLCGSRFCRKCLIIDRKIKETGKEHCWICGEEISICDQKSKELGFDECEMLAK